jgi:hypothetical protein
MATYNYLTNGQDDGNVIGASATEKVGFFGATPVVQQSISLGAGTTTTLLAADVAAIKAALVSLGLVAA